MIPIDDIETAVEEIFWAREAFAQGGVMLGDIGGDVYDGDSGFEWGGRGRCNLRWHRIFRRCIYRCIFYWHWSFVDGH